MRLFGSPIDRAPPAHLLSALALTNLLVGVLAALLFLPPWMLPRAAAMLPLVPIQNPSEEESHSSHSAAAQLQQLSAVFGGKIRRPAAGRSRFAGRPRLGVAVFQLARCGAAAPAEQARRNGCGAPLRC